MSSSGGFSRQPVATRQQNPHTDAVKVLARFLLAASDAAHFPAASLPEVAFLGRSNVGKSSVINSLLGLRIAKTSATPGRTRTINFYEVRWPGKPRPALFFADLPGYGYARLSRQVTAEWAGFVEPYLAQRPTLGLAIVLVDCSVPPQESDKQLLHWLGRQQRNFLVVATKADRLSGNALPTALAGLQAELGVDRVAPFSARTGDGRDELWRAIRSACGEAQRQEA
jgi:GTP-binding protein